MNTKKLTLLALFSAVAYVVMLAGRLPISTVEFLTYDPKDAIIVICGFMTGPVSAFAVTLLVSLIEMLTVSATGILGFVMNVISTSAFACCASFMYEKKRTLGGAVGGLAVGGLAMTVVMAAWNYLVTPFYMGVPRETVAAMILPVFIPFNVLKASINAAVTFIIYKPVSAALVRSGLLIRNENKKIGKLNPVLVTVSGLILLTCILVICAIKGII